jgi:hypothetical protein
MANFKKNVVVILVQAMIRGEELMKPISIVGKVD